MPTSKKEILVQVNIDDAKHAIKELTNTWYSEPTRRLIRRLQEEIEAQGEPPER